MNSRSTTVQIWHHKVDHSFGGERLIFRCTIIKMKWRSKPSANFSREWKHVLVQCVSDSVERRVSENFAPMKQKQLILTVWRYKLNSVKVNSDFLNSGIPIPGLMNTIRKILSSRRKKTFYTAEDKKLDQIRNNVKVLKVLIATWRQTLSKQTVCKS